MLSADADDRLGERLAAERTRLAETLHDGPLQELALARQDLHEAIAEGGDALLRTVDGRLARVALVLRGLSAELHEPSLREVRLDEALEHLARAARLRGRVVPTLDVQEQARGYHDPFLRECVRELLVNAEKHARSSSVAVSVRVLDEILELRVADDGPGFDHDAAVTAREEGHLGLQRIERVAARLGGRLAISAGIPTGTVVTVRLPVEALAHRGAPPGDAGTVEPGATREPESAQTVMRGAARRDANGHSQDLVALARDRIADARDRMSEDKDRAQDRDELRATAPRPGGRGRARARTVVDDTRRADALQDRVSAAGDRERSALERLQAKADRSALVRHLSAAETDSLTGTRSRAPGLVEVATEVERCARTDGALTVAYVDVVGLKRINDTQGHTAGDDLLRRVVLAIRDRLRSYDVLVRLGGDEFLCVLPEMSVEAAEQRFAAVRRALVTNTPTEISVGYATFTRGDSGASLIARADADLLRRRPARATGAVPAR